MVEWAGLLELDAFREGVADFEGSHDDRLIERLWIGYNKGVLKRVQVEWLCCGDSRCDMEGQAASKA